MTATFACEEVVDRSLTVSPASPRGLRGYAAHEPHESQGTSARVPGGPPPDPQPGTGHTLHGAGLPHGVTDVQGGLCALWDMGTLCP